MLGEPGDPATLFFFWWGAVLRSFFGEWLFSFWFGCRGFWGVPIVGCFFFVFLFVVGFFFGAGFLCSFVGLVGVSGLGWVGGGTLLVCIRRVVVVRVFFCSVMVFSPLGLFVLWGFLGGCFLFFLGFFDVGDLRLWVGWFFL